MGLGVPFVSVWVCVCAGFPTKTDVVYKVLHSTSAGSSSAAAASSAIAVPAVPLSELTKAVWMSHPSLHCWADEVKLGILDTF